MKKTLIDILKFTMLIIFGIEFFAMIWFGQALRVVFE